MKLCVLCKLFNSQTSMVKFALPIGNLEKRLLRLTRKTKWPFSKTSTPALAEKKARLKNLWILMLSMLKSPKREMVKKFLMDLLSQCIIQANWLMDLCLIVLSRATSHLFSNLVQDRLSSAGMKAINN